MTWLREQVVYAPTGRNLTGSFMNYAMTTAADPSPFVVRSRLTPTNRTPIGR